MIENLKEKSLVGIRIVYDSVCAEDGLKNLTVTKNMIHYAWNACLWYKEALKRSRVARQDSEVAKDEEKWKKKLWNDLKLKKVKLMENTFKESQEIGDQIAWD